MLNSSNQKKMFRINRFALLIVGIFFLLPSFSLQAQELTYEELIESWIKSKDEAFEKAKAEGKYVLLFAGRTTCGSCKASLKAIKEGEDIQAIIKESYVLWYTDWDQMKTNTQHEARAYFNEYNVAAGKDTVLAKKILPGMFIIDPENPEKSVTLDFAVNTSEKLIAFLDISGRPVSNEIINVTPQQVYLASNTLTVSNNISNETITVYTITGQRITSFLKKGTDESKDATSFPKGVLIVSSSAGWSNKVLNR